MLSERFKVTEHGFEVCPCKARVKRIPGCLAVGVGVSARSTPHGAEIGRNPDSAPVFGVMVAMGIAGIGLILMTIPLTGLILARVPRNEAGAASGTVSIFQQVGAAVGIAVSGALFFNAITGSSAGNDALRASVAFSIIALAVCAVGRCSSPRGVPSPSTRLHSSRTHRFRTPLPRGNPAARELCRAVSLPRG